VLWRNSLSQKHVQNMVSRLGDAKISRYLDQHRRSLEVLGSWYPMVAIRPTLHRTKSSVQGSANLEKNQTKPDHGNTIVAEQSTL
jgi:hypothetical protein